jgi:hypothetical protein
MEFGATNTSIPNPLMPRASPPKKPMELNNAIAGPVSESLPFTAGVPENLMELDNVATGPGPSADPNTVPKASIVSLWEPAVHADQLPTTGSVPTPPEKLTITTSTSIPNPLTPSPPEKLMELAIATAGPVSEPLPFTVGLPENLMELDNAASRPVTEFREFNTGPPMEPNVVPETPIISLQEPAVNTDPLLNSRNMDQETMIPLQTPTIVTAQTVRLEGQPNMFRFGKTQAGTRRKRDGDRRLERQETDVS